MSRYEVDRVRAGFPALDLGVAHFDGPGGPQTPAVVAGAVAAAMTSGISNRGTVTDAEQRAENVVADGRAAKADLLGPDPRGIIFGRSMTALTFDLARTLSQDWGPGDEVWRPSGGSGSTPRPPSSTTSDRCSATAPGW